MYKDWINNNQVSGKVVVTEQLLWNYYLSAENENSSKFQAKTTKKVIDYGIDWDKKAKELKQKRSGEPRMSHKEMDEIFNGLNWN